MEKFGLASFRDEMWKRAQIYVHIMGPITPFAQLLDLTFNHVLKKEMHSTKQIAKLLPMLAKYFTSKSGKDKAGHVNGLAVSAHALFSLKFPVTEVSSHRRDGYNIGGWTLPLKSNPALDKHFLKTLFKCEVGGIPDQGLSHVLRGIDPFNASLADVEKAGSLSGVHAKSRGITKPSHITESRLKYSLEEAGRQGGANDPRIKFLAEGRRAAKIFHNMAVKALKNRHSPSKDSFRKFLQNKENLETAIDFFKTVKEGKMEKRFKDWKRKNPNLPFPKPKRTRLSYKMKAKGCRTLDSFWKNATGGRADVPDCITDKWLRNQRKKEKEKKENQKNKSKKTLFAALKENMGNSCQASE